VLLGACEPSTSDWARRCLAARSPALLAITTSTSSGRGELIVLTVPKCDGRRREDGLGLLRFVQSILSQSSNSPLNDPAMAPLVQSPWALRSNVIYYSAADRIFMGTTTKSNYDALSAYVTASTCSALVPSLVTLQPCKAATTSEDEVEITGATTKGWRLDLAKGTKCQGQSSLPSPFPCIGPPPPPVTHRPTPHPSPQPLPQPTLEPSHQPSWQPTGRPIPLPSLYPSMHPTLLPITVPYVRMGDGDGSSSGETMLPAGSRNASNLWQTPLYLIGAVYCSTLLLAACFLLYRRWHAPNWTTVWDPDQMKANYDVDGNKHGGQKGADPIDYVKRRNRRRRERGFLSFSYRWVRRLMAWICSSVFQHLPRRRRPNWTTVWDPSSDNDEPASPDRAFTKGGVTVYQASFEAEPDGAIKGRGIDENGGILKPAGATGAKERSKSPKSSSRLTAKIQLNSPPGPHDI